MRTCRLIVCFRFSSIFALIGMADSVASPAPEGRADAADGTLDVQSTDVEMTDATALTDTDAGTTFTITDGAVLPTSTETLGDIATSTESHAESDVPASDLRQSSTAGPSAFTSNDDIGSTDFTVPAANVISTPATITTTVLCTAQSDLSTQVSDSEPQSSPPSVASDVIASATAAASDVVAPAIAAALSDAAAVSENGGSHGIASDLRPAVGAATPLCPGSVVAPGAASSDDASLDLSTNDGQLASMTLSTSDGIDSQRCTLSDAMSDIPDMTGVSEANTLEVSSQSASVSSRSANEQRSSSSTPSADSVESNSMADVPIVDQESSLAPENSATKDEGTKEVDDCAMVDDDTESPEGVASSSKSSSMVSPAKCLKTFATKDALSTSTPLKTRLRVSDAKFPAPANTPLTPAGTKPLKVSTLRTPTMSDLMPTPQKGTDVKQSHADVDDTASLVSQTSATSALIRAVLGSQSGDADIGVYHGGNMSDSGLSDIAVAGAGTVNYRWHKISLQPPIFSLCSCRLQYAILCTNAVQ